ncbi:MAG TPA: hypothetical protein VFJ58_11040 [Armatimonadota bacterium]|nr:hypothetical protein [Armatimonadota bacterium]
MNHDLTLRLTLEYLVVLVYDIPPDRLRPLLTDRLAIHKLDVGGGQRAILATFCGRVRVGRPGGLLSRFAFGLASHCACVQWEDKPGVYDFRTVLTPPMPARLIRLLVPTTRPGVSQTPAKPDLPGAIQYAISEPGAILEIEISQEAEGPLHEDYQKILSFLVDRRQLYFWFRGRYLCRIPFDRPPPDLRPARVHRVRIPIWAQTGLVSATELRTPAIACWSPAVTLECRLPRLAVRF